MDAQARWRRANPATPGFQLEDSPFYWLTRVSGRYLLQMERHLKAIGMDVPRWRVLMILAEDEPATITNLSERSVVKLATMTRIVQRMAADGLVTTEGSITDGRVTQVSMTAAGRDALARVRAEGSRVFVAAFGRAHAAEVDELVVPLRRLFDRLNAMPFPAGGRRTGATAVSRRQSPIFNANRLKLGLFSPNCSGGMAVTKVAERWDNRWDNNIALARMADEAGLEFLLPIARWIGYGGETDFHGSVLGNDHLGNRSACAHPADHGVRDRAHCVPPSLRRSQATRHRRPARPRAFGG